MSSWRDVAKENVIVYGVMGGIVLCVVGAVVGFAFFGGGTYRAVYTRDAATGAITEPGMLAFSRIGFGLIALGVVVLAGAVAYGLYLHRTLHVGPEVREPHCRVMARFGVNSAGEMLFSDWQWDAPGMEFFVKMHSPSHGIQEFQCARPVFLQCGEGMLGEVVAQGNWLSSFEPYIGAVPPYEPPG